MIFQIDFRQILNTFLYIVKECLMCTSMTIILSFDPYWYETMYIYINKHDMSSTFLRIYNESIILELFKSYI